MSSKTPLPCAADPLAVLPGGVLEIAGRDAGAFLQAQLMSDVRLLADRQWQWSGWLSAKGRVQALGALLRLDAERFWLLLPDAPAAELAEQLRRFQFRSRLSLLPRPDLALRGVALAPAALGSAAQGARADPAGEGWILDFGGERARSLLIGDGSVPARTQLMERDGWALEDLAHGLPRLDPRAEAGYTPQMLGLARLNAYSVKKGCYPGQEIVARTHFLGQAKRELRRLSCEEALHAGQKLTGAGAETEVLCAAHAQGRREALAILPREGVPQALRTASGSPVEAIPFAPGLAR
jgi:tRNA-modifying protein YgfZ